MAPSENWNDEELKDLEDQESGLIAFDDAAAKWSKANDGVQDSFHDDELAERMISEELEKLSLVEHEKIMFDIHGIAQIDEEDPYNIDDMLAQIETEINKIKRKDAYNRAKYLDDDFVTNRSFRLRFLRCDRFDAKLAAQRIVRHFEVKQKLFGDGQVLARDVRLADMSELDMKALESGFVQVLPSRDASGRSIFSVAPMHRPDDCPTESCGRAVWYILNTTMSDEDAQRRGIVGILSNFGEHARTEPFDLMMQIHRVRSGIPKKIVGIHYCYDDASMKPFVTGVRVFLAKEIRTRFRPHFGDRDDIAFQLQTYGIPTKDHPILPNGVLSLEWHREWLNVRRTQEESDSSKDGFIIPRRFDVLFGRGKNTRNHTGNLRAAHLVEMHQKEYERAGKFQKTELAERIVVMIHESFGRFLRWEEKGWVEVDADAAREKISHFFRHLRSKTSSKGDDSDSRSSNGTDVAASVKRVTPCVSPIYFVEAEPGKSSKHPRDSEA